MGDRWILTDHREDRNSGEPLKVLIPLGAAGTYGSCREHARKIVGISDRDAMETLAAETGGRAIVQKNDLRVALGQVIRDSRAYYLIAYESPHPDDGRFHKVTVRVKRPRATVFARNGYWAFKSGENTVLPPSMPCMTSRRTPDGWSSMPG